MTSFLFSSFTSVLRGDNKSGNTSQRTTNTSQKALKAQFNQPENNSASAKFRFLKMCVLIALVNGKYLQRNQKHKLVKYTLFYP